MGNIDPTPAVARFEIDGTPPSAILVSPVSGQAVRDSLFIMGTAADPRFHSYRLDYRSVDGTLARTLATSTVPTSGGNLGGWNTTTVPDGDYEVRLSVTDSLGLTGSTLAKVIVDNHAPSADVTAPVKIPAASGGDIYTTNSELHLYFPPRAFREDALVMIVPNATDSVPQELPSGALQVLPGYGISWSGEVLEKQATLEFSLAGVDVGSLPGSPALYGLTDGTTWRRLGGTVDRGTSHISLEVTQPGRYALFADQGVGSGARTLSSLSFTPRVFSPTGNFADHQVGIGFSLGQPGPVTVRVYNRSGRLIREVLSGEPMNAGANLVRWDGRGRNGDFVTSGIYLVSVEALGMTTTKPLAVVK
jgi:hypothetical protein